NGRHTLLLLALPIASCCGGLYCARCSYARREYAMWSWHPYACTMSRRSGWQGWWPGSCRRRISIEMAGDLTLCGHRGKRRRERTAGELRVRTARMEGTAARDVKPVRALADDGESPGWRAPRGRGSGYQGGGIRVPGLSADGFSAADLDEFAQVHETNPITHILDSSQMVADQEIGEPACSY